MIEIYHNPNDRFVSYIKFYPKLVDRYWEINDKNWNQPISIDFLNQIVSMGTESLLSGNGAFKNGNI